MAVSIVGLLLAWPLLIWSKGASEFSGSDFKVLVLLAVFWLLGTQGLTVLVTFPAGRYIRYIGFVRRRTNDVLARVHGHRATFFPTG